MKEKSQQDEFIEKRVMPWVLIAAAFFAAWGFLEFLFWFRRIATGR